jgi:MOSC domain-containing protein YiiM
MKVLSVNVGLPREVVAGDEVVLTSIFKEPVSGRVPIRDHNLAGNQQADLRVHGGVSKAVYAYPSEHYPFWREQLDRPDLTWGTFGENLTIEGLLEDAVHLGDRLRIGSAELVVTQPRLPCFKLGIRLSRPDIVKSFMASRRSGFYLAVASEGDIAADDTIAIVARDPDAVSIRELLAIHQRERQDTERLRRVVAHPALSDSWRTDLGKRLRESV